MYIEAPTITKIAADSRSTAVAGAIAGTVRGDQTPVLQAIGDRNVPPCGWK